LKLIFFLRRRILQHINLSIRKIYTKAIFCL